MKLYLYLKNGISEIEASETPREGFVLYELTEVPQTPSLSSRTIPDGFVEVPDAPLKVQAGEGQFHDVAIFSPILKVWEIGAYGDALHPYRYALRRGTAIARANGIPDEP